MRRERFSRGGGRGGRGNGGGGGGGRHHGGGNGRRGGRRRGGRGRGGSRGDLREQSASGNQRERISIESGYLVLIDQFMLANPQFAEQLRAMIDDDATKKDELVRSYGGLVVQLEPGTYRIERDPFECSIVIHHENEAPNGPALRQEVKDPTGVIYVDTRCLAMIDRELLDDSGLLEKYQQLWFSGEDKACRDLLRDNGGAVRYGFQRYGDDLNVHVLAERNVVCLWPTVMPTVEAPSAEQAEIPMAVAAE